MLDNPESSVEFLLMVAAGLFVAAATVLAIASSNQKASENTPLLWPIFLAEFLIVAMLVFPVYLGGLTLLSAMLLAGLRGQYELICLLSTKRQGKPFVIATVVGACLILSAWFLDTGGLQVATLLVVIAAIASPLFYKRCQYPAYSLLFPLVPIAVVLLLDKSEQGTFWLLFVYLLVEVNDAFALLLGKLFGKRHPFPVLSPGKTAEGLMAGAVISSITGIGICLLLTRLSIPAAIGIVLAIIVAGIIGDLAISALKRNFAAKDFVTVLPGHGGILDIYDSFLVAVTIFYPLSLTVL